jgi:hypothetical protein
MFNGIRARVALALAVAAVAGTSVAPIAPAFAAAPAPATDEYKKGLPAPDVTADIQVSDFGTDHENFTVYFTVKNIGDAKSSPIPVKGECVRANPGNNEYWLSMAKVEPALDPYGKRWDHFTCNEATGARLTVGSLNDSNTANNVIEYHWQ